MTILHTLKYPISYPPKLEELEALPPHIYKKWLSKSHFPPRCRPKSIVSHYQARTPSGLYYYDSKDIQELRKLIANMRKD